MRPVVANLAVRPEARRRGIAKKLMKEVELLVSQWGYQEVWLLVEKDNKKARKLYSRLGYQPKREEDDDSYKAVEGRIMKVDVVNVYMRKSLGAFGFLENLGAAGAAKVLALALLVGAGVNEESRAFLRDSGVVDVDALYASILSLLNL